MKRTLRSNAIVPSELYVERAADRQLRAIIDEMGRPGYVLVARQMGKTNLLLNMKRERNSDIVVYHDLSNRLDNASRWFRNLIDSILEAYGEHCPNACRLIPEQRQQNLEANIEYDRHMRLILRETNKKIIIILDEVDSLIKTNYSDVIFSQIRSMYFSRANFSEYDNLTYVLSGVMEPGKIIKDKNISPFNIGEKIYLTSFSKLEVRNFLKKAGLNLSENLVNHIYSWAAGNPRMTWDICAEIEKNYEDLDSIDVMQVDEIVAKLYLEEFDRPPIDHIRTLVRSDAEIRDAIVSVRYGKTAFLSEDIKNKLYLAGITDSAGDSAILSNKIIDLALSEQWINRTVHAAEQSSGLYLIEKGDYRGVIAHFEKQLASNDATFSTEERAVVANSYLQLARYSDAVREYRFCLSDKYALDKQSYYFGLGQALAYNEEFKEAAEMLARSREGNNSAISDHAYLIEILLIDYPILDLEESLSLCASIAAVEDVSGNLDNESRENVALACFIYAKLLVTKGPLTEANEWLSKAKNFVNEIELPTVELAQAGLALGKNKTHALRKIIPLLGPSFVGYPLAGDIGLQFGEKKMAEFLLALAKANLIFEFQQVSAAYADNSFAEKVLPFMAIKHLYGRLATKPRSAASYVKLLIFGLRHLSIREADGIEVLEVLREIVASGDGYERAIFARQYLSALRQLSNESRSFFNSSHVDTLANIAIACFNNDTWRLERELYDVWESFRDIETAFSVGNIYMDFFHLKGATLGKLASRHSNVELANRILQTLKNNENIISELAGGDTPNMMKREAEAVLKSELENVKLADPFRNIKRNDRVVVRYDNSLPLEKKFKAVSDDLRAGKCTLLKHIENSR